MSATELLKTIAEKLGAEARVTNVFGEPVTRGDWTVIPVASVSYGFGGGGGGTTDRQTAEGGGGGYVRAVPVGVIEILPTGTRFIAFSQARKCAAFIAISTGLGFFLGSKRRGSTGLDWLLRERHTHKPQQHSNDWTDRPARPCSR
jgi:uncharacterized spore protein YtfJ